MKHQVIVLAAFLCLTGAQAATFPSHESARSDELCKAQWTKRGELDQGMYDYCMERESEGYDEALLLIKRYNQQPWIQAVIDFAIKKWTKTGIRQDSMVHYAIQQMTEGWEDLAYEAKQPQFNPHKYQSCLGKWGIQFDMVMYCYKK